MVGAVGVGCGGMGRGSGWVRNMYDDLLRLTPTFCGGSVRAHLAPCDIFSYALALCDVFARVPLALL